MTLSGAGRAACYGTAMRSILLLATASLLLAACAKDHGTYPSLARRPVERINGVAPVVTPSPTPAPVASPELVGNLDRLVSQARAADAKFRAETPRTRTLIAAASGAAVASESWSVATVALASLESQRSQAMIALADLDGLYAAEGVKMGDTSAIAAARDQVIGLVRDEDAVLNELKGGLKS
ncbi:MAG: hypothetical protein JSR28_06575 [Proteobacteria bacterium]|nr:hypothetical protein [Pseudomonadota bacterium]MDE2412313.1 hypothetical protein [Sphingomonadales bacterium]